MLEILLQRKGGKNHIKSALKEKYNKEKRKNNVIYHFDSKQLQFSIYLMQILLKCIHAHRMVTFCFSGSTYSLSTLIHTATLIVQRLHRGLGLAKSFYKACWEVYASAQQSPKDKKVICFQIQSGLQKKTKNLLVYNGFHVFTNINSHTLSTDKNGSNNNAQILAKKAEPVFYSKFIPKQVASKISQNNLNPS